MSKVQFKSKGQHSNALRPNEGTPLDLVVVSRDSKGSTFAVNIGSVPAPDRKYVADVYSVTRGNGCLKLLFAQERIGTSELRSLLVIHVSQEGVSHFLDTIDEMHPPFAQLTNQVTAQKSFVIDGMKEPKQTVALAAGFVLFAASGPNACLDFLQASSFSVAAAEHAGKMSVEPVVRVELSTGTVLGLINDLREFSLKAISSKGG